MLKHGVWLTASMILGAAALLNACNDGIESQAAPRLEFDPVEPRFVFPKITVDEYPNGLDVALEVHNVGLGSATLAHFEGIFSDEFSLYYRRGCKDGLDNQNDQIVAWEAGQNRMPKPLTIEADRGDDRCQGRITFLMNFKPTTDAYQGGKLIFDTNDPELGQVQIPIIVNEGAAEIVVTPTTLDYQRVPAGAEKFMETTVTNLGQLPLIIENISINGSPDFGAFIGDVSVADGPMAFADPDGDGVPGLAPNDTFPIRVRYFSETDGPDEATMTIASNGGNISVNLRANAATSCIQLVPTPEMGLEFSGGVAIGREGRRPVSIVSCGEEPLKINSIRMDDTGDAQIYLAEGEVPPLPALLPGRGRDAAANPTRTVNVTCKPDAQEAYGAHLIVESDDPLTPVLRLPITCRGVLNQCPVPVIGRDEIEVRPLDIIDLDASQSTDRESPDGRPVAYEWHVMGPDGSNAGVVEAMGPNPRNPNGGARPDLVNTPTGRLWIDLVGEYTVELRVKDSNELWAPSEECPEPLARLHVVSKSDEDIHLQMTWHTPGDRDETDVDGSDIDMHFMHPQGTGWNRQPHDCYYGNINPDWGLRGVPDDNPRLDIDDTNGAGPENINLNDPEDTDAAGGPYRVGAIYYRAENFLTGGTYGPSEVTMRIYIGGVIAYENPVPKVMQRTGQIWEVAHILWSDATGGRVREVDTLR